MNKGSEENICLQLLYNPFIFTYLTAIIRRIRANPASIALQYSNHSPAHVCLAFLGTLRIRYSLLFRYGRLTIGPVPYLPKTLSTSGSPYRFFLFKIAGQRLILTRFGIMTRLARPPLLYLRQLCLIRIPISRYLNTSRM